MRYIFECFMANPECSFWRCRKSVMFDMFELCIYVSYVQWSIYCTWEFTHSACVVPCPEWSAFQCLPRLWGVGPSGGWGGWVCFLKKQYFLIEFVSSGTANLTKSHHPAGSTQVWSSQIAVRIHLYNVSRHLIWSMRVHHFIPPSIYDLSFCEHFHLHPWSSRHVFIEN